MFCHGGLEGSDVFHHQITNGHMWPVEDFIDAPGGAVGAEMAGHHGHMTLEVVVMIEGGTFSGWVQDRYSEHPVIMS